MGSMFWDQWSIIDTNGNDLKLIFLSIRSQLLGDFMFLIDKEYRWTDRIKCVQCLYFTQHLKEMGKNLVKMR